MLKKFKLPALALGTALAIMSPGAALARDHDDRDHERHERHERREHVWRGRGPGVRAYYMATARATRVVITIDGAVGTLLDSTIVGADGIPTND
jgi:hypothetical protein